ncbi:MAG: recombinase family protein [Ruminococcaceae bacterium]|nr:recombinase family protein [Oscillospiraceae bacterium]
MHVAYIRVSTAEQNEQRQVDAMQQYDIEKWFIEKVSGKDKNRPKLQEMLNFVREGDTVHIHDFSRLARSTKDLLDIVEQLNQKNVRLVSNKESLDTSTATGRLMLTVVAAIAQFERECMLERQLEGIAAAKKDGRYKGGKRKVVKNFDEMYARYMAREINKVEFAKALNVSRPTLDKLIAEHTTK